MKALILWPLRKLLALYLWCWDEDAKDKYVHGKIIWELRRAIQSIEAR